MQDFINSFKAHLYERTASPLLGSFVFYWIVCNYKLIVILLDGDMKVNEKFDLIKTIYPQNIWVPWEGFEIHYSTLLGNGFLLPLLISLLYILISPFPSKWIYQFWKNNQKELLEIKQKIDDETPLTKEQSQKIKEDYRNLEEKYYNILLKNETKKDNNTSDHWAKPLTSNNEDNDHFNISTFEIDILLFLSEHPNSHLTATAINNELKGVKSKTDYFLENLTNKNFIIRDYDNNFKENTYAIYQKGREYLVKNDLI